MKREFNDNDLLLIETAIVNVIQLLEFHISTLKPEESEDINKYTQSLNEYTELINKF